MSQTRSVLVTDAARGLGYALVEGFVSRRVVRVRRQWCTKQNKQVEYTKTREARAVPVPHPVLEVLVTSVLGK